MAIVRAGSGVGAGPVTTAPLAILNSLPLQGQLIVPFATTLQTQPTWVHTALKHLKSPWLGWVIFLAVFLHKIPEGFTVTSVMLASGLSKGKSWFASVMLGLATLAGVLTMAIGQHAVSYGLPIAAGVTIYVAASDLIPEVNREPGVGMALVVFVGVAMLFLLDRLFHLH